MKRLFAPLVLILLLTSGAQARADKEIGSAVEAQEELDKLMYGRGSKYWMLDGRSLAYYLKVSGQALTAELKRLGRDSTWLDSGVSEPMAQLHYLSRMQPLSLVERLGLKGARANAVAVSLQEPTGVTALSYLRTHYPTKFRFVPGNIKDPDVQRKIGIVDLITDIQGPMAFDLEIEKVWEGYHKITKPGSRVILVLMADRLKLFGENGDPIPLTQFFARLPGFKLLSTRSVPSEHKGSFAGDSSYKGQTLTLVFQRTSSAWRPLKTRFKRMRMGAPPVREFFVSDG